MKIENQVGLTVVILCSFLISPAISQADYTSGLNLLDQPKNFRPMRSSSADPNWSHGNGDCRAIAPGDTLTLADLQGPGRITHIWFTVAPTPTDLTYNRKLTLRMYWDGQEQPAVESPLGDFFAVGHGALINLNSQPVAISSSGRAYNCYWPMPFRKSAKITVTNDSDKPIIAFFWYIDWQKVDKLPKDTPYFHAQYRQEFPCKQGQDYLILDAKGKGHYVGTVLSWQQLTGGWPGEGDDFFYIDGEKTPSLKGTGTEDYFCDAWGFAKVNNPYYGVSVLDGWGYAGWRCTAYRWHIQDPIPFKKSLKVTIEHFGTGYDDEGNVNNGFAERADNYSSVAFWYQTGTAKRFAQVPPGPDRLPKKTAIEIDDWFDGLQKKPLETFLLQQGQWSGGRQLLITAQNKDWQITVPFEIKDSAKYLLELSATKSFDYGKFDIILDGKTIKQAEDFYNPAVKIESLSLGVHELTAGQHKLQFKCAGSNPSSKIINTQLPGCYLGLDAIMLTKF